MFFAALLPPNNSLISLLKLKNQIFSRTHSVSALALQPMVPFIFCKRRPDFIERKALPPIPKGGLVLDGIRHEAGQCCLSIGCGTYIKILRDIFREYEAFDGINGVHLYDLSDISESAGLNINDSLKKMEQNVFHWDRASLAVYRTESVFFIEEDWWKMVVLENLYEIRLPVDRKH